MVNCTHDFSSILFHSYYFLLWQTCHYCIPSPPVSQFWSYRDPGVSLWRKPVWPWSLAFTMSQWQLGSATWLLKGSVIILLSRAFRIGIALFYDFFSILWRSGFVIWHMLCLQCCNNNQLEICGLFVGHLVTYILGWWVFHLLARGISLKLCGEYLCVCACVSDREREFEVKNLCRVVLLSICMLFHWWSLAIFVIKSMSSFVF